MAEKSGDREIGSSGDPNTKVPPGDHLGCGGIGCDEERGVDIRAHYIGEGPREVKRWKRLVASST